MSRRDARRPAGAARARTGLVVLLLVAAGCGGDPARSAVADTGEALGEVRSATLDLRLLAGGLHGDQADAGFRLRGPFALPDEPGLPIAELEYTQVAGDAQQTVTILATGEAAYVEIDGTAYELPPEQAAQLETPAAGAGGFDRLGVEEWFAAPRLEEGDGTDRVTGEVDVVAVFNGIAAFATDLGVAEAAPPQVEGDEAERLRAAVEEADAELVTGSDDRLLRSLTFTARLRDASLPPGYDGGRIAFELRLDDINAPVNVAPPADAQPPEALPSG